MKRIVLFCFVISLVIVSIVIDSTVGSTVEAATRDETSTNQLLQATGSVSGTVVDQDTGLPIENINVNVYFGATGNAECTDATGFYSITVPLDTPLIVAAADAPNNCGGPANYYHEFWQETADFGAATTFTVTAANPDQPNIDFTLEVGGIVSGTVFDQSTGLPIAGMNLWVDLGALGPVRCTDSSGDYSVAVPFDTPFKVIAATGTNGCGGPTNYLQEWWQEASTANAAALLTVTPSNPNQPNIDFTLEVGGTVSGTVTDQDTGLPIANVNVSAYFGGSGDGACTDASGNYSITVPFDTPLIAVAGDGSNFCGGPNNYLREYWQETPDFGAATTLTVTAISPDQPNINFTLDIGGTISGTVVDQNSGLPIENMKVNVFFGGLGFVTCSDSAGVYSITVPLDTSLIVTAASGASSCSGPSIYLEEFWQEASDFGAATPVIVTAGSPNQPGINFTLEVGGTVSGIVTDQDTGLPIENMKVSVYFSGTGNSGCTDASGAYSITVPFDTAIVAVASDGGNYCGGPNNYIHEYWQETFDFGAATLITVTAGNPVQPGINFTLEDGGTVSGTVVDQDTGLPIANMNLWVEMPFGPVTCTDSSGNYLMTIPLDTPFKVVAGAGNNHCGSGPNNYLQEYWQEVPDTSLATVLTVTLANPDQPNIDFTLEMGGSVSGNVTDEVSGLPVPDMRVKVDFGGSANATCTDFNGDYNIKVPFESPFIISSGSIFNFCGGADTYAEEWWQEATSVSSATVLTVTSGSPVQTGINFTVSVDDDSDGVSDSVEDSAPNGGDGNNDGTPDSQQDNVTSLPNAGDNEYISIESPPGTTLSSVSAITNPSPGDTPAGVNFPVEFFDFEIQNLTPGSATTVTVYAPVGTVFDTYYKYGPTPGNATPHWYEFLYDGTTGAQIAGNIITLHYVDGQRGDDDLTANGVIVDPGAPSTVILTPTDTPISPTDTPVPPTDTPIPPTDTPDAGLLVASAICVDENLAVTISSGDGPFDITASAGINTPVDAVSIGTTTINGPEKWDNVMVTETSGDLESINLGQFRCRTDERPLQLTPAHRARTTNPFPAFSWTGITSANNYRVFVFDDANPATRTVDIRQNSGGTTSMTLSTPLPNGRLFWRVRGRQNRLWSLWSVRFTLFKDPAPPLTIPTPVPAIELDPAPPVVVPTAGPVFPAPPNSR